MKIPFDRDIITERMNDLGLSERTVISQTGFPQFTFRRARQTGEFEGTLTLRQLAALADTLGVSPAQLLAHDDEDDEPDRQPESAQQDASLLIPLLVDLPRMVTVGHITRALGWERSRVHRALDAIPAALTGTGLRLHCNNGSVKVTAADPTDKRLKQALGRVRNLGLGVNTAEASALLRILNGDNVLDRMASNPTRVAVGALKNMGCISLNDEGVFEATDDLRLALPDL